MVLYTEKPSATSHPLPTGWKWLQLEDVCDKNTGTRNPENEPEDEFYYVDISSVDNVVKKIVEPQKIKGSIAPSRARQIIFKNDVIVSTTRPNLNAVALVPDEYNNQICSTGFCVLRPSNNELLDSNYLFFFVRSCQFIKNLSDLVKGALYPAVTNSQVFSQYIPLPPLAEQKRIAALLNARMAALDTARAAAEAQLQAAKDLPAAYLRAIFESSEATRWPQKRLADVAEIGSGVTLGRKNISGSTTSVPYLRVANVKDGYLDLSDVYEIQATEADIKKCRLKYGDLLLTEGGDPDKLGRGTFWQNEIPLCIHQNHIYRVRFDLEKFSPEFLSAQIGSGYGKAYFLAHAKQTTGIATINQQVLGNFPLMVPPIAIQKQIASIINTKMENVKNLRVTLETQLAAIKEMPAALLRQAFNGELY